jgi:hypothetical protein
LEAITALEAEIDLIQSNAPDTFPKPTSKFIKFYIYCTNRFHPILLSSRRVRVVC